MGTWNNKTAIICGATSGLGLALTRQLAQQRAAKLFLIARTETTLISLADELQAEFPSTELIPLTADMTSKESVQRVAAEIGSLPKHPPESIDLLIQAVGKSSRGDIDSLHENDITELMQQNVIASVHATQHLRSLLKQPGGCIVMIGSLASRFAPRFLGGYAIAKHALAAFASQARLELEESGLHVLLACPGPIARPDAGTRYEAHRTKGVPDEALAPGGGAKVKGLDINKLAIDILSAAHTRKPEIIRPRKARLLLIAAAISPRLGDWLLRRKTS
ncbi:MAG: SDR family oxidoreductase [Aureliella sp.]